MSRLDCSEFGKLRAFFWPIHRFELKKLIPMLSIFFLVSLNYNILRCMKDTLVVTAKSSGAEVIPFIKVWAMLPMAFLFTYIFTRLSNRYSRESVFYWMLSLFLGFFAVFAFILYPNRDMLHPHELADRLQLVCPKGLMGLIAMFRYWTYTCFYVMAELWSAIILSMVFWGFANHVTSVKEAKRFYGLFGIGANIAGVASGQLSIMIAHFTNTNFLSFGEDPWHRSLILLSTVILTSGGISMAIFRWFNLAVLTDSRFYQARECEKAQKTKPKFSVIDSFRYLRQSPYLMGIAVLVVAYNLVINLIEVVWKHEVRLMYPNSYDYNIYMNQVTIAIGIIATTAALFVSGNAIRRCGWTFTALMTPMILLLTSLGFFSCFFAREFGTPGLLALLGVAPQALIVFLGTSQNVLSRAAKYSVYDATKELAFIPLSNECKVKGKATIDGVGSRLGKSGGSVIHQILLMLCGSITASTPFVAVILFGVIFYWITSTRKLGKQFDALTQNRDKVAIPDSPAPKEPELAVNAG